MNNSSGRVVLSIVTAVAVASTVLSLGWTERATSGLPSICPLNCSGNGACLNDSCICDPCFTGEGCETECSGNGACLNASCACDPGFSGEICGDGYFYGAAHDNVDADEDIPEFWGESTLYSIDAATGAATPIGPIGFLDVSGIAFHPTTGILYGTGRRMADPPGSSFVPTVLITIDLATGQGTEIGRTNLEAATSGFSSVHDLSFRSDGTLFGAAQGSITPFTNRDLVTFDLATGAATFVGTKDVQFGGDGIAFSPGGTLYNAQDWAGGNRVTKMRVLDPATGASLSSVDVTYQTPGLIDFARLGAMDFSSAGTAVAIHKEGYQCCSNTSGENWDDRLAVVGVLSGNVIDIGPTQGGMDAIAVPPGFAFDAGDVDLPDCTLTTTDLTGNQVQFTIQDLGSSGLDMVNTLQATNATVSVPPFMSGTGSPVVVTVTADGPGTATVELEALDVAGNTRTCGVVAFQVDDTPPTCSVYVDSSSSEPIVALVQDTVSGIASITATVQTNATLNVPAFSPGENGQLEVRVGQVAAGSESRIRLSVTDVDGNQRNCHLVNFDLFSQNGNGTTRRTFESVDGTQSTLEYWNNDPGYERARATVGRFRSRVDLTPGTSTVVSVAGGLSPGLNTVKVQAWGKGGPSMVVTFSAANLTAY